MHDPCTGTTELYGLPVFLELPRNSRPFPDGVAGLDVSGLIPIMLGRGSQTLMPLAISRFVQQKVFTREDARPNQSGLGLGLYIASENCPCAQRKNHCRPGIRNKVHVHDVSCFTIGNLP